MVVVGVSQPQKHQNVKEVIRRLLKKVTQYPQWLCLSYLFKIEALKRWIILQIGMRGLTMNGSKKAPGMQMCKGEKSRQIEPRCCFCIIRTVSIKGGASWGNVSGGSAP